MQNAPTKENEKKSRSTQKGRINGIDSWRSGTRNREEEEEKKESQTTAKELGYKLTMSSCHLRTGIGIIRLGGGRGGGEEDNNDAHTMPKSEMRKLKLKRKPCHKSSMHTIERET